MVRPQSQFISLNNMNSIPTMTARITTAIQNVPLYPFSRCERNLSHGRVQTQLEFATRQVNLPMRQAASRFGAQPNPALSHCVTPATSLPRPQDAHMTLNPALCLAFGLIGLAACSSPQPAESPAPVGTEAALQGTWRSVDDARSMMTIRDTTVTESYLGEEPSVSTLTIVADCNEQAPDPAGPSFTLEDEAVGVRCFTLLDATGDYISYSYAARGNTLAFTRVPD